MIIGLVHLPISLCVSETFKAAVICVVTEKVLCIGVEKTIRHKTVLITNFNYTFKSDFNVATYIRVCLRINIGISNGIICNFFSFNYY